MTGNQPGERRHSDPKSWENRRDLIESVENVRDPNGTPATISKYAYENDEIGRRTSVVMTGSAFASPNDGDHHWRWGYNDRSELTSADRCGTTNPDPQTSCNPMTPDTYTYEYDPIGNREEASKNGATTFYCANELNQYETLDDTDDTCPQSPADESFDYDADGNLIEDSRFVYTWDGENRLIGVAPASSPVNGDKKLAFKYDYMNRRVEKRVYIYDSGWPADNDPDKVLRFVYDGWSVVLVLDGRPNQNNAILTKYTWGLDLSGQRGNPTAGGIHGAGGIGGLLAVEETAESGTPTYWFLYDANGNVGQVVENATGYAVAAHYEYDAYGNVLGTPTGYAAANPFRFSTKWFDRESGLGYWGYRYRRERWLNRDLLQEAGGLNLYSFTKNSPMHLVDPHGRLPIFLPVLVTGAWAVKCNCCIKSARVEERVREYEESWNRGDGRNATCGQDDAIQHCLLGALVAQECYGCVWLVSKLNELGGDNDPADHGNTKLGAQCAEDPLNCCMQLLKDGKLNTNTKECQGR